MKKFDIHEMTIDELIEMKTEIDVAIRKKKEDIKDFYSNKFKEFFMELNKNGLCLETAVELDDNIEVSYKDLRVEFI